MSDNTATSKETGDVVSVSKGKRTAPTNVDTKDVSMGRESSGEEEVDEAAPVDKITMRIRFRGSDVDIF